METDRGQRVLHIRATRAPGKTHLHGQNNYQRERHLPGLIAISAEELAQSGRHANLNIVRKLERALRIERAQANAGHRGYDLDRHLRVLQALRAEKALGSGTNSTSAGRALPTKRKRRPDMKDSVFINFSQDKIQNPKRR